MYYSESGLGDYIGEYCRGLYDVLISGDTSSSDYSYTRNSPCNNTPFVSVSGHSSCAW